MFWSCTRNAYSRKSFRMTDGKRKNLLLHRIIMVRIIGREIRANEFVDHINGSTFDNRRENLRLVTKYQNAQNIHGRPYRGAYYNKNLNKYQGSVRYLGKNISCGYFKTRKQAALAAKEKRHELCFLTENA